MKKFRFGGEGVLLLLGRSSSGDEGRSPTGRVFECKTCSRQFPSFQALGGHRASHKKPRMAGDGDGGGGGNGPGQGKPRVHECSVCGLEFAIGQALGGHMRRHRAESSVHGHRHDGGRKKVWLDLNLPPPENEMDCRKKMGFGIENIVDSIPMVDCFH